MRFLKVPLFFVKWRYYEYWPWWFFYFPMLPYWFFLALKCRSFSFFTATNTNIEMGGFFGERKMDILKQIPDKYIPISFSIAPNTPAKDLLNIIGSNEIAFPFIVKPNVGERGNQVEKIETLKELLIYNQNAKSEYIIQEFVTFSVELGVLFIRLPDEAKGRITSVTMKEFLSIKGDGFSSVLSLINQNQRARFQIPNLTKKLGSKILSIPESDEYILLEPIGNHCKGTRFINGNHLINERLNLVFNEISKDMNGFYYGRFDLKVKSLDDLYKGNNIKILELNGASSEPGHIYDSSVGLLQAYRSLGYHWNQLSQIATQNMRKGIKPASISSIIRTIWSHFFQNIDS